MDNERAKIIINNLLVEICTKTGMAECDENDYKSWLTEEIGLSSEEINELEDSGCLPLPGGPQIENDLRG